MPTQRQAALYQGLHDSRLGIVTFRTGGQSRPCSSERQMLGEKIYTYEYVLLRNMSAKCLSEVVFVALILFISEWFNESDYEIEVCFGNASALLSECINFHLFTMKIIVETRTAGMRDCHISIACVNFSKESI